MARWLRGEFGTATKVNELSSTSLTILVARISVAIARAQRYNAEAERNSRVTDIFTAVFDLVLDLTDVLFRGQYGLCNKHRNTLVKRTNQSSDSAMRSPRPTLLSAFSGKLFVIVLSLFFVRSPG